MGGGSEWYLVLFLPEIVQEGCKPYVLHFHPSGGLIDSQGKVSKFLGNAPRTIVIHRPIFQTHGARDRRPPSHPSPLRQRNDLDHHRPLFPLLEASSLLE